MSKGGVWIGEDVLNSAVLYLRQAIQAYSAAEKSSSLMHNNPSCIVADTAAMAQPIR